MARCRISLTLICLAAVISGLLIMALEVTSAATKAWVWVRFSKMTFSFGLFNLQDNIGLTTVHMLSHSPVQTMQAMLIFSIAFGVVGMVMTIFSGIQRVICGRGPKFFMIFAEVTTVLSAVLYVVGLSVFTHYWLKDPSKFFTTLPTHGEFHYGYSYWISWLAVICQILLTAFLIICINVMLKEQDRELYEEEEKDAEKEKLVHDMAAAVVEKAVVEAAAEDPASASTSAE